MLSHLEGNSNPCYSPILLSYIWLATLFDWFEEKIWKPIGTKLIKILGEDWGVIIVLVGIFVVLPIGINLYRHGFNFKNWT